MAGVKVDGKWGFINNKGKIVIKPRFEDFPPMNATAYAKTTAKHIAGTANDARSEADDAWRLGSTVASNIGTRRAHAPGSSIIEAIHGVSRAPPTIAIMSPAAPILWARGSIPPRPMP